MSTLLLVRHGQASWGQADYDVLSEVGHDQGRLLGAVWARQGFRPDRLVTGSMRRHRETAEAVGEAAGLTVEPIIDAGWDEFDHESVLSAVEAAYDSQDAAFDDALARWVEGQHSHDYAEPFEAFVTRCSAALVRTSRTCAGGETVAVFTSGGPIGVAAATLIAGAPMDLDVWRRLALTIVNASVTRVVDGSAGRRLVSFNEHLHLDRDHVTYR